MAETYRNPNYAMQVQGFDQPQTPSTNMQPVPTPAQTSPQQQVVQQTATPAETPQAQQPQATQPQVQMPTQQEQVQPPQANLQPGTQGSDVQALQNYLVQQGYLTPEQVATGPGIYGPKTTAAVAAMQRDLGINPGQYEGYYGPMTQEGIAQKYKNQFEAKKGSESPAVGGNLEVRDQLAASAYQTTDPVFGAMAYSMGPIMQGLNQVLTNINNPALTATSLQQEYNQLRQEMGVPALQSQLMNLQNVMTGTEQDIRDEISKSGGFATESQVLALAGARNKTLQKQYNALSTQYAVATDNLNNMMKYAAQDKQTELQRETMTTSLLSTMASIQTQMFNMGMQMETRAAQNIRSIVSQVGYSGLAEAFSDNPAYLAQAESYIGLPQGALNNAAFLSLEERSTYQIGSDANGNVVQYELGPDGDVIGTTVLSTKAPTPGAGGAGGAGGIEQTVNSSGFSALLSENTPAANREALAQLFASGDIDAGARGRLAPALSVMNALEKLASDNPEGGFEGLGAGRVTPTFLLSKEGIKNRSAIEAINLKVQQWASGAALTEEQTKQVARLTPRVDDTDYRVREKLSALYNFMLDQVNSNILTSGANISFKNTNLFEIRDLMEQASPEQRKQLEQLYGFSIE